MRNLYDLLADDRDAAAVRAWARGEDVPGLPRLSPAEMAMLADSWEFGARPGQLWTPGVEFITDFEAGRGFGKTTVGSETICDAALNPELWGGYAAVVGPDPTEVLRDPLFGKAGIFACAARRERSGLGPGIRSRNLNQRIMQFEAMSGGGGGGLTVHWAASSDPKSVHGMNVGLAWLEEFGVWYHRLLDEQGNNTWQALQPAIRLGLSKVIVTQTPSRSPEVRALQRDAERPECPTCKVVDAERGKKRWRGEPGREPWRLPRSMQARLHPLLNTRTTVPTRECPVCGGPVVAQVRCVFGDTTDNPALSARALQAAADEVATGTVAGHMRFAPRGEVDSGGAAALVQEDHIVKHVVSVPSDDGRVAPVYDRWMLTLARLAAEDVVVQVDPAVTATASSDETGVVASCSRTLGGGEQDGGEAGAGQSQVVGLQDSSVHPAEVEDGAPSTVWAPRAYRLACLWNAARIVVEVNQGGEEVLSAVRDLVARPPSEAQVTGWLAELYPGVALVRLGTLARRVAGSARRIKVESVNRVSGKPARLEWYGRTASLGRQAVLVADWLPDGARHWSAAIAQVTGYEPPRQDAPREKPRKDRGDALVASAQVLLGVRETASEGIIDPREQSWLGKVRAPA